MRMASATDTASSTAEAATAMSAGLRCVNCARKAQMPFNSLACSCFRLRSAALGLTPTKDSSTGSSTRLVNTSTATPMLALAASSWMTRMSISASTAKPTASHSSAVRPATNRRRKV